MPTDSIHRRADAGRVPYRDKSGFVFRPLQIPDDIPMLHAWFREERAAFWLMQDKTEEQVQQVYQEMMDSGHATAYIGVHEGRPAFLAECYDPAHDRIRDFYDVREGDLGMHIFVGPARTPVCGFTRNAFHALMRFMFNHLGARRIVVEPDSNNHKIHALNRSAGFIYLGDVPFFEKTASIAVCTRQDFETATAVNLEKACS